MNYGLRTFGGIGEELKQMTKKDEEYNLRFTFDFVFFITVNVLLMDLMLAVIVDSFGAKRSDEQSRLTERESQCFICGITKTTFDKEGVSWPQHIYCQHNMHAYLAFLLNINAKSFANCNGIEKYFKIQIETGKVDFYPINQSMALKEKKEKDEAMKLSQEF